MSLVLLGILNSQVSGAAAGSYDLLETQVLASSASSVTFTGLGSYTDYKHLQVRAVTRTTKTNGSFERLLLRINSDTSSIYATHELVGNGSSVSSSNNYNTNKIYAGRSTASSTADSFGAQIIDILDFASTLKNTTIRALGGTHYGAGGSIVLSSGLYNDTSAVTSITFLDDGNDSLSSGSRFSLYGIKGA